MEPIFKVRSMITESDYKKYLKLVIFKGKKTTIPMLVILPLILSLIISYFSGIFEIKAVLYLFVVFTVISFGVTFFKLLITYTRVKLMDTKSLFNTYNTFYFYEDEIVSENDDIEGKNRVKYISFYQVLESKEYFILNFSDFLVQIIRKKDFDNNEELTKFLKEKLNTRYRIIEK